MKQALALEIMDAGHNVLLTGAAGSGKTHVLAEFITRAKSRGKSVSVTATAGLAATHLGGNTIHAWSGIGIADSLAANFGQLLSQSRRDVINKADILIIDEISMLHDFRLDMVDRVAQLVRESNEPFGGLQVILCGDFFQLPPVQRGGSAPAQFVTQSEVWDTLEPVVCYLDEQHRQDDSALLGILEAIRSGEVSEQLGETLLERQSAGLDSGVTVTELHTTNIDVDAINSARLAEIDQPVRTYQMTTTGNDRYLQTLRRSCLALEELELKVGALVMCIKNNPQRKFANGSLGVVKQFDTDSGNPVVKLHNGRTLIIEPDTWELRDGDRKRAGITQLPLRLAWAMTIHKSQGMTLDAARIDLSRSFVPGMGYVALSRVRRLDTLSLAGINAMALRVSEAALEIDGMLRSSSQAAEQRFANLEAEAAARRAREVTNPPKTGLPTAGPWASKLARMRETYPNAYRPWAASDDAALKTRFSEEQAGLGKLTAEFGRHPGSIRARLQKHFGEDVMIGK